MSFHGYNDKQFDITKKSEKLIAQIIKSYHIIERKYQNYGKFGLQPLYYLTDDEVDTYLKILKRLLNSKGYIGNIFEIKYKPWQNDGGSYFDDEDEYRQFRYVRIAEEVTR